MPNWCFCFLCARSGYCCLATKPDSCRNKVVSEVFVFCFCLSYERTVCTIFSQLVFSTKMGIFEKKNYSCRKNGLRQCTFLCFTNLQLVNHFWSSKIDTLQKPYFIAFLKICFAIFSKMAFEKRGFWEVWKMKIIKEEVTNLWRKGNQKTLIWTKIQHKTSCQKNQFL